MSDLSALKDALQSSFADNPDAATLLGHTPEESGSEEETPQAPQTDEGAEGSTEDASTEEQPEGQDDGEGTEVPTEYLGVDLSGLDDEARAEVLKLVKGSDSYANRKAEEAASKDKEIEALRQEIADIRKSVEGSETPDDAASDSFQVPDDAAIAEAFGWDTDDDLTELRVETIKPLLAPVVEMQQELSALVEYVKFRDLADHWNTTLTRLDPNDEVNREALVDYAVEHGIEDPAKAFDAFVGPKRNQLREATIAQREAAIAAAKKKQSDGIGGKSREGEDKKPEVTDIASAIKAAEQETGQSLSSLFRR